MSWGRTDSFRCRMEIVKRSTSGNSRQIFRCQAQPDNKGWFDEECKTAIGEKNVPYKN